MVLQLLSAIALISVFFVSVILLAVFTIVYDSIGGMKGVIYSDVIQMFILYACIFIVAAIALNLIGGVDELSKLVDPSRIKAIDFIGHGLGDGKDFAFWPMFFGGLFLYVSYYGCDQTQVQRELSSKSIDDTNMSLFVNGILRFPLVLTYCLLGICIAAYAMKDPSFIDGLPKPIQGVLITICPYQFLSSENFQWGHRSFYGWSFLCCNELIGLYN